MYLIILKILVQMEINEKQFVDNIVKELNEGYGIIDEYVVSLDIVCFE